jgi:DNA (cytosine-5)-methyltransferase 1
MTAYYNEIDPDAAHIMRALIAEGVLAPGDVDTRSIKDVHPDDLRPYTQCHFFAGGGLWSVAARLAGWPDDREIWTGSCPCQPFSIAGKGGGVDDARHLWPDFFRLISARRPAVVVGEQVAGQAGYGWLDGVRADLAGEAYACRGVDIPACAVDAPHIRSRLYWCAIDLADAAEQSAPAGALVPSCGPASVEPQRQDDRHVALGDAVGARLEGYPGHGDDPTGRPVASRSVTMADGGVLPHANGQPRWSKAARSEARIDARAGRNGSWWSDHEWLACHDGKARRTQPGVPLLVDGLPGRVGLWRVAGNAISPVLAAEVIGAMMDAADLD